MIKIDLHGDSTQVGITYLQPNIPSTVAKPPSAILQDLMDAKFGIGVVLVNNKAIGGTTIANALHGESPYTQTWDQQMAASDANIVVTNHGINDAYVSWMRPQDYLYCVNTMAHSAGAYGKKFFIETPNPINNNHNPAIAGFVSAIFTATSWDANLYVQDSYRQVMNNWTYWTAHLSDGIHPDANLYEYKGRLLFNALEPHVRKLLNQ